MQRPHFTLRWTMLLVLAFALLFTAATDKHLTWLALVVGPIFCALVQRSNGGTGFNGGLVGGIVTGLAIALAICIGLPHFLGHGPANPWGPILIFFGLTWLGAAIGMVAGTAVWVIAAGLDAMRRARTPDALNRRGRGPAP